MKSGLYLKLSVNGIKKNKKLYLPRCFSLQNPTKGAEITG